MLATRGMDVSMVSEGWSVEPKLDGWRCLVQVDGDVRAWTRRGRSISESVQHLARIEALAGRTALFDGELIFAAGRAEDFYRLHGALGRHHGDVTFAVFDVLSIDGRSTIALPYLERREILEGLGLSGQGWFTVPRFGVSADEVLPACERLGIEGVMAKRLNSVYRPGARSRQWLKFKTAMWKAHHAPRRHEHHGTG